MRENRLRRFGHVTSREETELIREVMRMNVEARRGRLKTDAIENNLRAAGVRVEDEDVQKRGQEQEWPITISWEEGKG